METFLVIALVVTIGGFLLFLDRKDKRDKQERAALLVRIQRPEVLYPQEKGLNDEELMKMIKEEEDEIDVVGEVNPELPLRND